MKRKKLLIVGLALTMALTPSLAGCEQKAEDFILSALHGFQKPVPAVKEGRFNFSITYEVDGNPETVSSVFVCEFVKIGYALDGVHREWNSYIEDAELTNQLEQTRGYLLLKTCDDGEIYLDINLSAKYFMADPHYHDSNENTDDSVSGISPRLFIEYSQTKGEELGIWWNDDASVLESYGVKVISYEYDEPVQNSYE